jgi:hypothetical protein
MFPRIARLFGLNDWNCLNVWNQSYFAPFAVKQSSVFAIRGRDKSRPYMTFVPFLVKSLSEG